MPDRPESLDSGLPPRRDDEPADLRRDIVDELADHLACAMEREGRRGIDDMEAAARVRERFGDPAAVVGQLYADAMRETIMRSRLLVAAMTVVAVATMLAAGTSWLALRENQALNAALLAELKASNAAARAAATVPATGDAWGTLTLRLVEAAPASTPIAGADVKLQGYPYNVSRADMLQSKSGTDGSAVFGPMLPGKYQYDIRYGWYDTWGNSVVPPKGEVGLQLAAPRGAHDKGSVRCKVSGLEAARDSELLVLVILDGESVTIEEQEWFPHVEDVLVRCGDGQLAQGVQRVADNSWRGPPALTADTGKLQFVDVEERPALNHVVRMIQVFNEDKAAEGRKWRRVASYAYPDKNRPVLSVRADQVNDWMIELPAELIAEVKGPSAAEEQE